MRKLIFVAAALGIFSASAPAIAHPEDEGGYYQRGPSTTDLAVEAINRLVAQKKLAATWSNAKLVSFDSRQKNGVGQYVLTYENPAIKQAAKRKLFVIMSQDGQFISANNKLI
jgi:hypothetical protein